MATTLSRTIGNQTMTFEAGKLARLADGAAVVTYGETQVLATCVSAHPRCNCSETVLLYQTRGMSR